MNKHEVFRLATEVQALVKKLEWIQSETRDLAQYKRAEIAESVQLAKQVWDAIFDMSAEQEQQSSS